MSARDDLVTAGLLGLRRHPVSTDGLPGAVGDVVRSLPASDAAPALLDALAVDAVARRAASVPPRAPGSAGAVAPPEDGRVAGPAAAARLTALLARTDARGRALLTVWLAAAAERGVVAPAAVLPELLDLAAGPAGPGAAVVPVLGARGRWLAAARPGWSDALARRTAGRTDADAAPDEARAAIADPTFGRRPASERAALVDALHAALVRSPARPDDEELLVRALADRAASVRHAAARALVDLPGSAFARQCQDRALALVRRERRALRQVLVVDLPEPDDGSPLLGPGTTGGRRAALLEALVAATPPHRWEEHLGATPAQLVGRTVDGDRDRELHAGWRGAAVRTRDARWAAALVARHGPDPGLLRVLPLAEQVEALVARLHVRRGVRDTSTQGVEELWDVLPTPWPDAVVDAAMHWMITGPPLPAWWQTGIGDRLAVALSPDPTTEARVRGASMRTTDPATIATLRDVADVLLVRRQMLEELA
ncbi:DUF5691 domain-containing protein [Cellulomonas oligotrophica]|uniref:Uncharacterized protein n=1 Tax=Cellulomonas oligotrophica TaxID=931536 RepID=A0A7Y9FIG5_9CELL|nr:DUF5691 domain-containing protein [Cellulomonas oligotrophica]NYD87870.1 hypothetical protein [Cellulomonas oligotrophica]GIG32923.1 hypothetical protein Col01nite_20820 [Cellulomonas oligotrophica]